MIHDLTGQIHLLDKTKADYNYMIFHTPFNNLLTPSLTLAV